MPLHVPASEGQRRWTGTVEPEPGLALPCTIIRGRAPGPKLLVTAGVHGAEYSSIEAARRLTALSPESILGELTILPVLNIKAFWAHLPYVNPLDGKNINRVFPGDAKGSASERLAAWVVNSAMSGMDGYVDLHCGDIIEALLPFAIFRDGDARSVVTAAREFQVQPHHIFAGLGVVQDLGPFDGATAAKIRVGVLRARQNRTPVFPLIEVGGSKNTDSGQPPVSAVLQLAEPIKRVALTKDGAAVGVNMDAIGVKPGHTRTEFIFCKSGTHRQQSDCNCRAECNSFGNHSYFWMRLSPT